METLTTKQKNLVITGSAEGSFVFPALAVTQELIRNNTTGKILYIGTEAGLESIILKNAGIPFRSIGAERFSKNLAFFRSSPMDNTGLSQSIALLREHNARLVISFGGPAGAPILSAARILNIPYIIMEQNIHPARVNKMMAGRALKILTGFKEAEKILPPKKTITTGTPVRREILEQTRKKARKTLQIPDKRFTILITGAVNGTVSVNKAILKALPQWKQRDWNIYHLVGPEHFKEIAEQAEPLVKDAPCSYSCAGYTDSIALLYAAADLVISRAGASTLAEITAKALPSILIPYPYAPDNNQEKAAEKLKQNEAALTLRDGEIENNLPQLVTDLADNPKRLKSLSSQAKKQGNPEALEKVVREIETALNSLENPKADSGI